MSPGESLILVSGWNAIVLFISLMSLGGGFLHSCLIAAYVLVSSLFGYGRRWLMRTGFALSVVAIAVSFGAPHPTQWPNLAMSAPDLFDNVRAHFSPPRH